MKTRNMKFLIERMSATMNTTETGFWEAYYELKGMCEEQEVIENLEPSVELKDKAKEEYLRTQKEYFDAGNALGKLWTEWRPLMLENKFEKAKETLRDMPQCVDKVLIFKTIIDHETLFMGNK